MYLYLKDSQHVSALSQRTSKQAETKVAEGGVGQGGPRSGADGETLEAWSPALTSSSGLGRASIPLIADVSGPPWSPIRVTSEVSVQGSDSTTSTPVNNRLLNMVRSASYLQLSDCWT